jgi:hypothetical protein
MGFMISAINYDQFGHPGWIVGNAEVIADVRSARRAPG